MSLSTISIPSDSALKSIEILNQFSATIGQDGWIHDGSVTLSVDLIDEAIVRAMQEPKLPRPEERIAAQIDREIPIPKVMAQKLTDIDLEFLTAYQNSTGVARPSIFKDYCRRRREVRNKIVAPYARQDIASSTGLVITYGKVPGFIPDPKAIITLTRPDGRAYTCTTLIHYTHPSGAEERYLRECRIQCDRIIRYFVPGLDDPDRARQDEPREPLTPLKWKEMLGL